MSQIPFVEDEADFPLPGITKPTKTWYKVFGDLKSRTHRPLVTVHGGPGYTHDYLLCLSDLTAAHGIPVVVYDQVGNGKSTHLPETKGNTDLWTEQLFMDELENLLGHLGIKDDYDLLGHSWGGMLASRFASRQPKGLRRLVISDSPADMHLWVKVANELRTTLPQDVQDTLTKHEKAGTTDSKEYQAAVEIFNKHFVCRMDPPPQEYLDGDAWLEKDPTVYLTMNGPSEFQIIGSLKDWSMIADAHKIAVPTLLLNGRYDEAQDEVVAPFFQAIQKVKWYTFPNSAHLPQHEEREKYMEVVGNFLLQE